MKISHLEIHNFKSYFGRQIIGPFSEKFTCIIGPNGNGKSNILDAMLFVFGFKSSKLRQDSLTSLIHCSALGKPDQATVTVQFVNNSIKIKDSDSANQTNLQKMIRNYQIGQRFSVSRTIRRNGYCFYCLNDKKIQWNELKQFLISKGIDLQKNLFIILQGQVQRLCQLSSQKLVQYMQFISGSDQYLQKILQLQTQYVNNGLQLDQIKQKLSISNQFFVKNQKQTFQLLQYVCLKIKLVELHFLIAKKSIYQLKQNLVKYKNLLEQQKKQLRKVEQYLAVLEKKYQKMSLQHKLNIQKIKQISSEIQRLQNLLFLYENQQLKIMQTQLQYKIKDLKKKQTQVEFIQKEKRDLTKMVDDEKSILKNKKEIQQILYGIFNERKHEQKCNKKPGTKAKQQKNHQFISESNVKNQTNLNTIPKYLQCKQIWKLHNQIQKNKNVLLTHLQKQFIQTESKQKQSLSNYQNFISKYGQNGQKYSSAADINVKLKLRIRQLSQSQTQSSNKLSTITSNIQQMKRRIAQRQSRQQILTLNQKIVQQIKTANKYKTILPHRTITTLRQHILLPDNEKQLIYAITPQLDFIIVQNYQQARQIINWLNQRKIGRMSFILIDEVNKMMQGVSTVFKGKIPEGCKRIFDTGKVLSPQYEKIWFWCVANTLIAQTLDNAMKAAYYSNPNFRVITYKGQYIDISGAMTKIPINSNKIEQSQDKTILQTRLKIITNNFQAETNLMKKIRSQKQTLIKQLNLNLSSTNHQFSSVQQVRSHINLLQQEKNSALQRFIKIKTQIQLHSVKLKQKQNKLKQCKEKYGMEKILKECKLKYEQMIQLIDRHEDILVKIKKIELSQELVKLNGQNLQKKRNQMYQMNSEIQRQKLNISQKQKQIDNTKQSIKQVLQKKKHYENDNNELQSKLFTKQIQIKTLKGQITRQIRTKPQTQNRKVFKQINQKQSKMIKNNKNNCHRKNQKNNQGKGIKQDQVYQNQQGFVQLEIYSARQHNNHGRIVDKQDGFTLPSSSSILTIQKQSKRLNQLIQTIQYQVEQNKESYKKQLESLRNVFGFLFNMSVQGQRQREREIEEFKKNQNKQKGAMQGKSKKQQRMSKNRNQITQNIQFKKDENPELQQLNNKVNETINLNIDPNKNVKFLNVLLDFLIHSGLLKSNPFDKQNTQNKQIKSELTKTSQENHRSLQMRNQNSLHKRSKTLRNKQIKQKIVSKKSKQSVLKTLLSQQRNKSQNSSQASIKQKNQSRPNQILQQQIKSIIYQNFFNTINILNIGTQQHFFDSFISKKQYQQIAKYYEVNGEEVLIEETNKSTINYISPSNPQNKQLLLDNIQLTRLQFLQKFHKQKINQFQSKSNSVFIKSANKRNSNIRMQNSLITSNKKESEGKIAGVEENQYIYKSNQKKRLKLELGEENENLRYFSNTKAPLHQYELQILNQYILKKQQQLNIQTSYSTLQTTQKSLYKQLLSIRQLRTTCYLSTFNLINLQINKIYNYLTKGNAQLNLTNSINPFQGIEFSVRPYNKSWKSVNLLSGGQKTLTSLALIFACQQIKKFPFYFMDEIDAALDYKNVSQLGKYVKQKEQVQHIVISLRKNMYEQCDNLVCIYKNRDATHTIRIKMDELYAREEEIEMDENENNLCQQVK